jgi:hypothetical protein
MRHTPFHQNHEFVVCKCGAEFERAVRKTGFKKKLCPRCEANWKYELKRRKK